MLWYAGAASSISMIRKVPGLAPHAADQVDKLSGNDQERRLIQAVVAKTGPLVARPRHALLPAMLARRCTYEPVHTHGILLPCIKRSVTVDTSSEVLELEGLFTEA